MIKKVILIFWVLLSYTGYAQDPQTNAPKVFYPILDEYIKDGYDRNYRTHTRNLRVIDYVYVHDITVITEADFDFLEFGNNTTFKVYKYWHEGYQEVRYTVAFDEIWSNNYYVLRRMFYKAMGYTYGLKECHKECDHIMSGRDLMDNHLFIHDLVIEQWHHQLDIFFMEVMNHMTLSKSNFNIPRDIKR